MSLYLAVELLESGQFAHYLERAVLLPAVEQFLVGSFDFLGQVVLSSFAVFLVALMENGGQIVSHIDMQAILRSSSRSIMKVHASKLRKSLREKDIDVSLLSVKGGYGFPMTAWRRSFQVLA